MSNEKQHCLFSAPHSFLGKTKSRFNDLLPTVFREIWDVEELKNDLKLTAWIMSPFFVN